MSFFSMLQRLVSSDEEATDQCIEAVRLHLASTRNRPSELIYNICTQTTSSKIKLLYQYDEFKHDLDGTTALMLAAKRCSVKAVSILLQAGFDVTASDESGNNALMYAAHNTFNEITMATMLIEAGTPINYRNIGGQTALHLATVYSSIGLCSLLLAYGADTNIITHQGNNCLTLCNGSKCMQVIAMLLAHEIDIDHADSEGDTLLLNIFAFGSDATIPIVTAYLINQGADFTKRNHKNKSIVDFPTFPCCYKDIRSRITCPMKRSRLWSMFEWTPARLKDALAYN